jgi:hypothetical protein
MHFTPTSSSWLNLVERWFSELTTKKLRGGTHTSVRQLNADIRAWIAAWNDNPRPDVCTKTADQILESVGQLLPTNQHLRALGADRLVLSDPSALMVSCLRLQPLSLLGWPRLSVSRCCSTSWRS